MRKLLTIIPALLLSAWAGAQQVQTLSQKETHHINSLILNALDEYVRTASFAEPEDIKAFQRLFDTPDASCVFNDLPGTPGYRTEMSPREYSEQVTPDSGSLIKIEVSRVRKNDKFFQKGGRWHRRLTLDKYVMFIDNSVYSGGEGGVFFDTDKLLSDGKGTYPLEMDLVYDADKDRCLISSISLIGNGSSSALDSGSFYVILQPEPQFRAKTLYGNAPIVFNDYGQAFVPAVDQLQYDSDDYKLIPVTEAESRFYDVMSLSYRKLHHLRFKPRYSMTLGSAFGMGTVPSGVNFTQSSKATEFGLDFGFLFAKGSHSHSGLYIGAAYSSSMLDMRAENMEYDYLPQRRYKIASATETLGFTDLMVPFYFETEFKLGKYVDLSLDLGAKFYINIDNRNAVPYRINGSVITASNTTDFDLSSADVGFLDPGSYAKEPLDMSFFANLEFSVRLLKFMYLFASAGYEYGLQSLLPAYNPSEIKTYYATGGTNPVFPVAYGGGTNLLFRSFVQSMAFHRQGIWLSFGLKFKLNI